MQESLLFEMKWFDYRLLSVMGANFLFLKEFISAYRNFMERRRGNSYIYPILTSGRKIDPKTKKRIPAEGIPIEDAPQCWSGWKSVVFLRQWCDFNCIKYDFFWRYASEAIVNFKFKAFSVHLSKNKNIRNYVLESWKNDPLIKLSEIDYFSSEKYVGSSSQDDYYWHVYSAIEKKYPTEIKEKLELAISEGLIATEFLKKNVKELSLG